MAAELPDGWGFPGNSRKCHYFRGLTSLCGKWGFYMGQREPDEGKSKDDCAACRRALDKEAATT